MVKDFHSHCNVHNHLLNVFSEVVLGEFNIGDNKPGLRRKIAWYKVHDNYDKNNHYLGNDIALIR